MGRVLEEKVRSPAHPQPGDPHAERDVLHGLELLDLERFFPLRSVNADVEFLQWRTQDCERSRRLLNPLDLTFLDSGVRHVEPCPEIEGVTFNSLILMKHQSTARLGE